MFFFLEFACISHNTHLWKKPQGQWVWHYAFKKKFFLDKESLWLANWRVFISVQNRSGLIKKTPCSKITISKFTMLEQEPGATCSGNSICAFLQANNQVALCLCKQLSSAFVSQVSWSPTIFIFALYLYLSSTRPVYVFATIKTMPFLYFAQMRGFYCQGFIMSNMSTIFQGRVLEY